MDIADAPLLLVLALLIGLPLAAELGYRLHRIGLGPAAVKAREDHGGQISSAALALLGLLVAFTFAMAADRFETRRGLVVDEANAISTVYLRTRLLDEPNRGRLGALVADYASARPAFAQAGLDSRRLAQAEARTADLQGRIWAELRAALRTPAGQPLTTPLVQATNEMFDLALSRRAALEARVPSGVRIALFAFALVTAAIVGWSLDASWRARPAAPCALFALIACAIGLIADLDQPRGGLVRVSQSPMEQVAAEIAQAQKAGP